jgi:uncharacterized membrane protein
LFDSLAELPILIFYVLFVLVLFILPMFASRRREHAEKNGQPPAEAKEIRRERELAMAGYERAVGDQIMWSTEVN